LIEYISNLLTSIITKLFNIQDENLISTIDYWTTMVIFNLIIILSLISIGLITKTLWYMCIIAIVINLVYDRENGQHMPTLSACVVFTIVIMSSSALLAKYTYIHPLLTILSILTLIKEIPNRSKLLMFIMCACVLINHQISCAVFIGFLLTVITSHSKLGKELMTKFSKKG